MKSAKRGNSVRVFAGLGVLILLVGIAGWLTIRMLDLSEGLDPITGYGGSHPTTFHGAVQPSPAVVTKKIPPPAADTTTDSPASSAAPVTTQPETTLTTLQQALPPSTETEMKKTEEPEKPMVSPQTDSAPPEIRTAQSQGSAAVPSPESAAPQTPGPPPVPVPVPENTGRFSIQVGAFQAKGYAMERAAILKALGYAPYFFTTSDAKGRTWHTIRIGKFDTREKAREVEASIQQESDFPTAIMHVNSLVPASTLD